MSDNSSSSADSIREVMTSLLDRARSLALHIRDAEADEGRIWFKNLLLGLINSTLQDYRYFQIGREQNSPYLAAWSCRNLLELNVITEYILASKKNADDFKSDCVKDVKEFYETLSEWHKAVHQKMVHTLEDLIEGSEGAMKNVLEAILQEESQIGPQTRSTDEEADAYRTVMKEFGIDPRSSPKSSRKIAELIARSEEFNPIFKVCSKIVHRSPLSVVSSTTKGALLEVLPLLSHTADGEFLAIYYRIQKYFDLNGVEPPNS